MRVTSVLHRAARAALLPLSTAQLLTGAKAFSNPVIGHRWLNARGLHVGRLTLAHWLADRRRRTLAGRVPAEHAAAFRRDGYVMIETFLAADRFAALRREAARYRGPAREMVQGDTITRRIPLTPSVLRSAPSLRGLLSNPVWRGLLRYVGSHDAEPVCYLQTILPGAVDGPPDPQTALHADTFQPTVKAWLTLTDVAADEGPFVYVPGSHRLTPGRKAWERRVSIAAASGATDRLTGRGSFRVDAAELPAMGYGSPRVFAVAANTLIVADTSGFHARGASAQCKLRAEVWAYGRRNPFLTLPFDPWRIRAIGGWRAPAFWWLSDRLARLGLRPHAWKPCQDRSVFDPAFTQAVANERS